MSSEIEILKRRVADLERELVNKDKDLAKYRNELIAANAAVEKMIHQLTEELRWAGLIQKALCPTTLPNISGMEFSTKFIPGMRFGGDYFDIFEHEDRLKFGIILSSASGYAMSALFLSVVIKMSSQIEARRGLDPNKVMLNLAKEIIPQIQNPQDKAQVFYGVVDRRSFELSYCMAGLFGGYHYSSDNASWKALHNGTTPLSKDFQGEPVLNKVSLNPRDRIVLVTEGVLNAPNKSGEVFGMERLMKALVSSPKTGVHDLRNEILYRVEQHVGGTDMPKDQSVVVIEVRDKVIKLA